MKYFSHISSILSFWAFKSYDAILLWFLKSFFSNFLITAVKMFVFRWAYVILDPWFPKSTLKAFKTAFCTFLNKWYFVSLPLKLFIPVQYSWHFINKRFINFSYCHVNLLNFYLINNRGRYYLVKSITYMMSQVFVKHY